MPRGTPFEQSASLEDSGLHWLGFSLGFNEDERKPLDLHSVAVDDLFSGDSPHHTAGMRRAVSGEEDKRVSFQRENQIGLLPVFLLPGPNPTHSLKLSLLLERA